MAGAFRCLRPSCARGICDRSLGSDVGCIICGHCNDCCQYENLALTHEEADRLNNGDRVLLPLEGGWCRYTDQETKLCTIYEQRPLVCRKYDCSRHKPHEKNYGT